MARGKKTRRTKTRSVGKVLHICFEDRKSARCYIEGYKKDKGYGNQIKLEPHRGTDPKRLLSDALRLKKAHPNDEIWIVYDAESPQQRNTAVHREVWDRAKAKGIHIALSSICYETWVNLHYGFSTAPFATAKALETYIQRTHNSNYSKSDENIFSNLKQNFDQAITNAERLEAHNRDNFPNEKPYNLPIYTDFHKLIKAVDQFVAEGRERPPCC